MTDHAESVSGADPFIARLRTVAKECGYAIGVHGSQARDLDLIAAPWAFDACGAQVLVDTLCDEIPLHVIDNGPPVEPSPEAKPWGRLTWSLAGCPRRWEYVDLSVCPRAGEAVPVAWSHRRAA